MPLEKPPARERDRRLGVGRARVGHDHGAMRAEACERVALLGGEGDRRAHDWLVVTLLTDPLPELLFELELDPDVDPESELSSEVPLVCELVTDVVAVPDPELDATVAAEEWLASAGS
jgi:hypothetical protein